MPTYLFQCKKCKNEYYDLVNYDATGKYPKVKCPKCKSKSKEQLITTCAFQFAQPEGTDKWNSDSKGHDYRFKHNVPKVQDERKMAEAMSHMGANPYNQLNDIELDTGIHDPETRGGLS